MLSHFSNAVDEFKKIQFPSFRDTYVTTMVVFAVVTVVAVAILLVDFVILKIIGLIFGL